MAEAFVPKKNEIGKFWIKIAIWAVIQIVIWNLPPSGALTAVGVHTIAAFVGLIFGLIFIPQYGVPTLGCAVIMGFSGLYPTMNASFVAALGNDVFVMIFSIMMVSGLIAYTGLAKVIAQKMINAKFTAGRPYVLTLVILLTGSILSTFIHPLVIIAILADLVVEVYRGLNIKGNRWTMFVLASMAVTCIQAQNIMPFQLGNSLFYGLLGAFDPRLTLSNILGPHMLSQFLFLVLELAFSMLMIRIFCNNCMDEVRKYVPSNEKFRLNDTQKKALYVLIGYIVLQLLPEILPEGVVKTFLKTPALSGWSAIAVIAAMCIFRSDKQEQIITFDKISSSGFNWYILMMLFGLSSANVAAEATGIIPWLTDILTPICQSVGPYGAYAVLVLFCLILTNLADNIAVIFLEIPILYTVCMATGLNPLGVQIWALISIQLAILLPASSPHMALVFAKEREGYLKTSSMIGWMLVWIAFGLIIFLTIGWWLQPLYPNPLL